MEKQLADAELKKEQMIKEARQEAVKLIHDGETSVEKRMAVRIEKVRESLVAEKEKIILDRSADTEKIKIYSEQNFDRTIPLVLDIFERSVNAQTPEDE